MTGKEITPDIVQAHLNALAQETDSNGKPFRWIATNANPDGCRQLAAQAKDILDAAFRKAQPPSR